MAQTPLVTFSQSATIKVFVIGLLSVVLCVPLVMIWALVEERAGRRSEVEAELESVWGRRQTVGGLAVAIPYETTTRGGDVITRTPGQAVVLPRTLAIDARLTTEVRRRSIFSVVLYRTTVVLTGSFARPDFSRLGVAPVEIGWDRAAIHIGVSDLRGVVAVTPLAWGDQQLDLEPAGADGVMGSGLRAVAALATTGDAVPFRLEMTIAGSEGLMFLPAGERTDVTLHAAWPHAKFAGAFLPTSSSSDAGAFEASWQSNALARPYPQAWVEGAVSRDVMRDRMLGSAFGAELITPVDHYQQTARALKYGFLFIIMTFGVFAAWETIGRLRLHPIQYLLVGLALVVFFLLLLSLSEHVRFAVGYATASAATITLVAGYAQVILGGHRSGVAIGAWLLALYGLLFVLLQLEDLALLVGSVAVFAVLVAIMYFTRRIDWYAPSAGR